jgi:hypothetical protein
MLPQIQGLKNRDFFGGVSNLVRVA